ncbi:hypothetical protein CRE_12953 [Caenorhabditis remanei]|uniref:DNA-directed DNA polymerase n=1 Tax=Caenorhabditis remanei TaxID=31234 RepID=E3N0Y5_CAERE|nr:hypothetical protein CRE_12953 [Caenorhabditis remanei]
MWTPSSSPKGPSTSTHDEDELNYWLSENLSPIPTMSDDEDDDFWPPQAGSGRPIPPPEVEEFIPNMHFPTSEEIEYLDTFVQYKDATFEELNSRFLFRKLNDRLVKLDENGFELINLDKVDGSFEQHLAKLFDIFIRHMIEKAGGSLEKTRFWFELSHQSEVKQHFYLQHVKYANGTGHHLLNRIALHMQSNKEFKLDEHVYVSMFIFKDKDTRGGCRGEIPDRIKDLLKIKKKHTVLCDSHCLPISLILGKIQADMANLAKDSVERKQLYNMERTLTSDKPSTKSNQLVEAKKFLKQCGLDENVGLHDKNDLDKMAEHLADYQIVVFIGSGTKAIVKSPDFPHYNADAKKMISLLYHNNHYEMFNLANQSLAVDFYYCDNCCKIVEASIGKRQNHKRTCTSLCRSCGVINCPPPSRQDLDEKYKQRCDVCHVFFYSRACYEQHTQFNPSDARTPTNQCMRYYYCETCCKKVSRNHECGKMWCSVCCAMASKNHNCCHALPSRKQRDACLKKQENCRYFVYDFETIVVSQSTLPIARSTSQGPAHKANVVCGQFMCHRCVGKDFCNYCQGQVQFTYADEEKQGPVVRQFANFILTDPRFDNCILLAHNGGKYDHSFIIAELVEMTGTTPELLMNGNQIIFAEMVLPGKKKIIFKDTLQYLPMALSQMPKAFGFEEMTKGTFPYMFNHPDHYHKEWPTLPDRGYYEPDLMKPAVKEKFNVWYEENYNTPFNFDKEILKYCEDDVKILAKAVSKYLEICTGIFNNWNPIIQTNTLAGFVMFMMKFEHFQEGVVGYIPENGFRGEGRSNSVFALKYLQWLNELDPALRIRHALNGGEKIIKGDSGCYYVDGYSKTHDRVYEVSINGCMWHGCPDCFPARDQKCPCRPEFTFEELYMHTMDRQKDIESHGYKVTAIWECQIRRELKASKEMRTFFEHCRHTHNLVPRESMFGGRTQPFQAYANADENHTIEYLDYCSLYPWTNMKGAFYPKGQPKVIRSDFEKVVAEKPLSYRGLVFCDVLPPLNLEFGVLPFRAGNKLLFPLCRTCAIQSNGKRCTHNEEKQRYLTGSWVTEELNLAIEMGYKVKRIHEVWHWDDSKWFKGGFFESFLAPLLKLKHEASGWPRPDMSDEEKQKHIDAIFENDGVRICAENVKNNPALRQLAKLFLNSAWGKFAQNPQKTEIKMFHIQDSDGIFAFFNQALYEPTGLVEFGANHVIVSREPLKEGLVGAKFTNIVYGSITTAIARLRLFEAMRLVGQENLIYCDTDSVIFKQKIGEDPLKELKGDGLGMLTDEIPAGTRITEVVTVAPKCYALKMENEIGKVSYTIKSKGMTLNCATMEHVSFEKMKKMVSFYNFFSKIKCPTLQMEDYVAGVNVTPLYGTKMSMKRPAKRPLGEMTSSILTKRMRPVTDKGVLADGWTLPYGCLDSDTQLVENYPH